MATSPVDNTTTPLKTIVAPAPVEQDPPICFAEVVPLSPTGLNLINSALTSAAELLKQQPVTLDLAHSKHQVTRVNGGGVRINLPLQIGPDTRFVRETEVSSQTPNGRNRSTQIVDSFGKVTRGNWAAAANPKNEEGKKPELTFTGEISTRIHPDFVHFLECGLFNLCSPLEKDKDPNAKGLLRLAKSLHAALRKDVEQMIASEQGVPCELNEEETPEPVVPPPPRVKKQVTGGAPAAPVPTPRKRAAPTQSPVS